MTEQPIFGPIRWENLPTELAQRFINNYTNTVYDMYIEESGPNPLVWNEDYVKTFVDRFTFNNIISNQHGYEPYGGSALLHVISCIKYPDSVKDKEVAVIGSITPWVEAILINGGAKSITTVEYNQPQCSHPIIQTITYSEFCQSDKKYDSIFSFSSIEHSGLGRYGDQLDPEGDIKTMGHIHRSLKPNSLLFLGIPVGRDALTWNAHRVYGPRRLGLLFDQPSARFEQVEWIGLDKEYIHTCEPYNNGPQPIIVLRRVSPQIVHSLGDQLKLCTSTCGERERIDSPKAEQTYRAAENNYQPYCNGIDMELEKNGVRSFLTNDKITGIVGVSKDYGHRYACQLQVEFPEIVIQMNGILRNVVKRFQSVGGSEEYLYPGYDIPLTPYTTRYLYQACIIVDYLRKKYTPTDFKDGKVNLIEIGGGFGGLAFWIQTFLRQHMCTFRYQIVDLDEANRLQDHCLKEWKVDLLPLNVSDPTVKYFIISNYAYSEFNAQVQEHYKKNIIDHPQVSGGFMIWNNLTGITQFTQKEMKIEPERPYFPDNDNKFIYF